MKLITTLVVLVAAAIQFPVHADEEVDLIDNMRALQYHAHKAALAIDKRNLRLAHFYEHELEEALEETTRVEAYHDQPIGRLTQEMLLPVFERFAEALDDDRPDWRRISRSYDDLIDACNACHQATGYDFIRLQRTRTNPFMQSFEP